MAQSWVWGWEKAERCREQQLLEKDDESALGSLRYFGGFEGCFVQHTLSISHASNTSTVLCTHSTEMEL